MSTEPAAERPWDLRRDLLRTHAALIRACTREMDTVQVGGSIGPQVTDAFIRYREARHAYLDRDTPGA